MSEVEEKTHPCRAARWRDGMIRDRLKWRAFDFRFLMIPAEICASFQSNFIPDWMSSAEPRVNYDAGPFVWLSWRSVQEV